MRCRYRSEDAGRAVSRAPAREVRLAELSRSSLRQTVGGSPSGLHFAGDRGSGRRVFLPAPIGRLESSSRSFGRAFNARDTRRDRTYFESAPFEDKRQFGHSRDKRRCVQVVIALVVTPDGPLAYEVIGQHLGRWRRIEDQQRSDRAWTAGSRPARCADTPVARPRAAAREVARDPLAQSVDVKLLTNDGELFVLVRSERRVLKERSAPPAAEEAMEAPGRASDNRTVATAHAQAKSVPVDVPHTDGWPYACVATGASTCCGDRRALRMITEIEQAKEHPCGLSSH